MNPAVTVREVLEASRRAGFPFGAAWPHALEQIDDDEWLAALTATAVTWARAYRRAPVRAPEAALDLMARGDAGELVELDALPRCPVCDNVVRGQPHAPAATYCSRACQKHAADRRDRGREHVARDPASVVRRLQPLPGREPAPRGGLNPLRRCSRTSGNAPRPDVAR